MEFKPYINTFFRTIKAYNSRERVASHLFLAFLIALIFKLIIFAGPSIYTEGYSGQIVALNPLFSEMNDVDRDLSNLIFSGLAKYDPKSRFIVSDMATLKVSEDKKTYTFTLKEHVKWHDGKEVSIDDVYFTFHDVIQSNDFTNPLLKSNFSGVEIEKIDERTIKFSLEKPNSFFITNMTVGILPKHLLSEVPVAELQYSDFNSNPIGSGPYKVAGPVKNYSNGQTSVTLERFNDYYGNNSQIKKFKVLTYTSVEHMVDDRYNLNSIAKITGSDALPLRDDDDFELIPYKLPQYTALFMNMDSSLLKKTKVRIGVLKAIDKKELLSVIENAEIIDTPLLELNNDEWIYEPDFDEANGALYDSGFKYDKEGDEYRKDSDGNVLELKLLARKYPENSRLQKETADLIDFTTKCLKDVGVKVSVELNDFISLSEAIKLRDYDLLLAGQSLGYNLDTFAYWHSSQASEGGLNLSNYKSFKVDTLLAEVRDTFDANEKQEKLVELATVMAEDVPAVILYRPIYYFATDGEVIGMNFENLAYPGDRYLSIADWK